MQDLTGAQNTKKPKKVSFNEIEMAQDGTFRPIGGEPRSGKFSGKYKSDYSKQEKSELWISNKDLQASIEEFEIEKYNKLESTLNNENLKSLSRSRNDLETKEQAQARDKEYIGTITQIYPDLNDRQTILDNYNQCDTLSKYWLLAASKKDLKEITSLREILDKRSSVNPKLTAEHKDTIISEYVKNKNSDGAPIFQDFIKNQNKLLHKEINTKKWRSFLANPIRFIMESRSNNENRVIDSSVTSSTNSKKVIKPSTILVGPATSYKLRNKNTNLHI